MPRDNAKPEEDAAWLLDMLTAARAVQSFVTGKTFEHYKGDLLLRSGVERQSRDRRRSGARLVRRVQDGHPEIPWRPIMAQRHRLAHEYGEINDSLIWNVATVHVPKLIEQIEPLIPPAPPASNDPPAS